MAESIALEVLKQAPFGYACHQLIYNDQGQPEDYLFHDLNSAFEKIAGLKRAAILGKKLREVSLSAGSFDWAALYSKLSLTGESVGPEYGELLDCRYKISAFTPVKGYYVTIFIEAASEVIQTKEKIDGITADLQRIFDTTQDAMFILGVENGNLRYIVNNNAHQQLTGYSSGELKGKTPEEALGQEMGESLKQSYIKAIEERRPIELEETLNFREGRRTWHSILTPVIEEGEVKYIIGSRKDITLQKKAEEEKENLLRRFQAMFTEHSAVMLLIEPLTGKIVDANPAACLFYGYTREKLVNMCIQEINRLSPEEVEERRLLALKEKQKYFLFPHRLKNGEIRLVDVYSSPITYGADNLLFSIIFDVTDREEYKNNLYREKELLRTTLLSIGDGVVTTDREGRITTMNSVAQAITGIQSIEEVKDTSFDQIFKLINEQNGEEVENPIIKALATETVVELARNTALLTQDGRHISISDSAAPIKDEKGDIFGAVMVFRDITSEKESQDRIVYLSYHDTLTGLFNRRFAEEEILRLDTSNQLPLTIIMGDVNGLKFTNDVFGHATGDRLLQKTAETIKESCRKEDIVARWGGDEFLILMPRTTAEEAEGIIQRIKSNCAVKSESTLQLSISMGCAVKTKEEESLKHILQEAEENMYHLKLLEGRSYRNAIINVILRSLYEKSMETEEHGERLKYYCYEMGHDLKCSTKEIQELVLLAILHDIGKIGIKESILQKPGSLTSEEWEEMKRHPEIGYRITHNIPELSSVSEYILFHHERWDGQGYPKGLKGKEIPFVCRILAVADAYDAMTTARIYRTNVTKEEALAEIKRNAGTQFDPEVVKAFLKLMADNKR